MLNLKNNRAPENDAIPEEYFKNGNRAMQMAIHQILIEIWSKGELLSQRKENVIIPLHKKRSEMVCSNY